MKKTHKRGFAHILGFTLSVLPLGCHQENLDEQVLADETSAEKEFHVASQSFEANAEPSTVVTSVDPAVQPEVVPVPVVADVVPEPIYPAKDPHMFARSVFDNNDDIPPWQANYVGSYGVLPTRFASDGPFLYSFEVPFDVRRDDAEWIHDRLEDRFFDVDDEDD